jgi:ribose 5-phosphate isomerase A
LPADVDDDLEREKRLAAEAAAALVEDGMSLGLGSGSSASYFVQAVAARELELRCVATSPATEELAMSLGLDVQSFEGPYASVHLDLAVDGADQVSADGWIVKGRGGAHTREKIVAAAAARFVVIVSSDKIVDRIEAPIPLELLPFGLASTLVRLGDARLRDAARTPDGGILADYLGQLDDPARSATWLSSIPGVVDHGLFEPELVSDVLVGRGDAVEHRS